MKKLLLKVSIAIALCHPVVAAQLDFDPTTVGVYITPYYNSQGPTISVGRFSTGLASENANEFLATISKMKQEWEQLSFPELYVAAIRLYDLGYRHEAVYWFYTAQYRGRQFGMFLDQAKQGSIGDAGFELFHAQDAFYELVGPYINGYAFGDTDALIKIIERVQKEGRHIPDLQATYRGVAFRPKNEWEALNTKLAVGMGQLVAMVKEKKEDLKRQRVELGIEAKFAKLTSKELTSRSLAAPLAVPTAVAALKPSKGNALILGIMKGQVEIIIREVDGNIAGELPFKPAYRQEVTSGTHKLQPFCTVHHDWGNEMGPATEIEQDFSEGHIYQLEYVGKNQKYVVKATDVTDRSK